MEEKFKKMLFSYPENKPPIISSTKPALIFSTNSLQTLIIQKADKRPSLIADLNHVLIHQMLMENF
jgi:hypothetical protein